MPSRFTRSPWRWSALIALPVIGLVALSLLMLPTSERGQASALPVIRLGAAQTDNNGVADEALTNSALEGMGLSTTTDAAQAVDGETDPRAGGQSLGQGATNSRTGNADTAGGDSSAPLSGGSPTRAGSTTTSSAMASGPGSVAGSNDGSSTVVTSGVRVQQRGDADSGYQHEPSAGDPSGGPTTTGTNATSGKGR